VNQPSPMEGRLELIRSLRSASERRDRDAAERVIRALVHPDCEWEPLIAGVEGGPYKGPEGALGFYDDFLGAFDVRYGDPDFRPIGPHGVLELSTMHMRGRESDVAVDRELGVVYEFDGDRLCRGKAYDSHDKAIAAAEGIVA
jgi:hypothetical protein